MPTKRHNQRKLWRLQGIETQESEETDRGNIYNSLTSMDTKPNKKTTCNSLEIATHNFENK
jgi:hypothetical protein